VRVEIPFSLLELPGIRKLSPRENQKPSFDNQAARANNLGMPSAENPVDSDPHVHLVLRCAFCGEELADLRAECCTTCSRPVRATLKRLGVDADLLAINTDLPCTHCEYNLRTMHIESKCPECGTSVLRSLICNDPRYANRKWLQRVRLGSWSITIGLGLVVIFIGIVPHIQRPAIPEMFFSTMIVLIAAGFFLTTSTESWTKARLCTRVNRIIGISSALLTMGNLFWLHYPPLFRALPISTNVMIFLGFAAYPVGFVSSLLSLRTIAIRSRFDDVGYFTITIVSIFIFVGAVGWASTSPMPKWASTLPIIAGFLTFLLNLVVFGLSIGMLNAAIQPHPPFATDSGETTVNE